MLEAAQLHSRYGRIPALAGIDLRVGAGELVALVGANGAGKSTLLRALSGVQASSGKVTFDDIDLTKAPPERRVSLGLVHVPEGRQVFGPLSVEDNLRLGAYRRGRPVLARSLERVYALFPALAERRRHAAGTLSGGQQQMLAIGMALMHAPKLVILDEPSIGLAPNLVEKVMQSVAEINRKLGTTILIIEQNVKASLPIAHRVVVLKTGRKIYDGDPAPLHDHVRLMELF